MCIRWTSGCVTRCWAGTLLGVDDGWVPVRANLVSCVVSGHSPHDLRARCDETIGPWNPGLFQGEKKQIIKKMISITFLFIKLHDLFFSFLNTGGKTA